MRSISRLSINHLSKMRAGKRPKTSTTLRDKDWFRGHFSLQHRGKTIPSSTSHSNTYRETKSASIRFMSGHRIFPARAALSQRLPTQSFLGTNPAQYLLLSQQSACGPHGDHYTPKTQSPEIAAESVWLRFFPAPQ